MFVVGKQVRFGGLRGISPTHGGLGGSASGSRREGREEEEAAEAAAEPATRGELAVVLAEAVSAAGDGRDAARDVRAR